MKTLNLARFSTVFSALVLAVAPVTAQELKLSLSPADKGKDGTMILRAGQDAEILIRSSQGGQQVWLQLSTASDNPDIDGLLTSVFSGKTDEDGTLRTAFTAPAELAGRVIHAQAFALDVDGGVILSNALTVAIVKDQGKADGERNARPTPEPAPAVDRNLVPSKPAASVDDVDDGGQAPAMERYLPVRKPAKKSAGSPNDEV